MNDDRYQFQPWYIKLYRRLRYMPLAYLKAAWATGVWAYNGFTPIEWEDNEGRIVHRMDRGKTLKHIWMINKSFGTMNMKWYYSLEETMTRLRQRINSKNARTQHG